MLALVLRKSLKTLVSTGSVTQYSNPRKLLESRKDSILMNVLNAETKGGALLAWVPTNKELSWDVFVNISLGCSYHAVLKFKILREQRKASSSLKVLDFCLFIKLVDGRL